MIVQKTVELKVLITVEYDDEVASIANVNEIDQGVLYGLQNMYDVGELFPGETAEVKEYSAVIVEINDTTFDFDH